MIRKFRLYILFKGLKHYKLNKIMQFQAVFIPLKFIFQIIRSLYEKEFYLRKQHCNLKSKLLDSSLPSFGWNKCLNLFPNVFKFSYCFGAQKYRELLFQLIGSLRWYLMHQAEQMISNRMLWCRFLHTGFNKKL